MQLGIRVKDKITGFTGIVTGTVDYLTGCSQALVAPGLDDKGMIRDSVWLDIQRLERVGTEQIILDNSASPGFDKAAPTY